MKGKKIIYIALGILCLGLGALGAVLPLLPAFPFLMLAAFCFAGAPKNWIDGSKAQNYIKTTWKPMYRGRA